MFQCIINMFYHKILYQLKDLVGKFDSPMTKYVKYIFCYILNAINLNFITHATEKVVLFQYNVLKQGLLKLW